ncbi:MAG: membrane integrity-associated transporter subunit PqiC [Alphaproteobacteria bacterium]|nr:membrane integrity-associated transporter subunit PqiC [Alphaproteobacteria bacterium]
MRIKHLLLMVLVPVLAACSFNNKSAPSRFYAITVPTVQQVRGPAKSTNVSIENVSVPQSVDRPQIVVKNTDSNMVTVSEFDRWVEGLNSALPVAISENMNLYARNINARPKRFAANDANTKYFVSVDFVRFETETDGQITIAAWWTVANNHGETLVQKKTTVTADTPDTEYGEPNYDAIVAEQSKLVAKLSYKIADIISELK